MALFYFEELWEEGGGRRGEEGLEGEGVKGIRHEQEMGMGV